MSEPKLTEAQWAALDRLYAGDAEVWTLGYPPKPPPPRMPEGALVLAWTEVLDLSERRLIFRVDGYAGQIYWQSRRLVGTASGRDWWRRQRRAAP